MASFRYYRYIDSDVDVAEEIDKGKGVTQFLLCPGGCRIPTSTHTIFDAEDPIHISTIYYIDIPSYTFMHLSELEMTSWPDNK